jgi:hypothetical protein
VRRIAKMAGRALTAGAVLRAALGVVLVCCGQALAQPAAENKPLPGIKKLLGIGLSLKQDRAGLEEGYVAALPEAAKAVDGVLLCVWSHYEVPDAPHHPLVRRMLKVCKEHDLEVYWGRRLWVSYPSGSSRPQQRADLFSSAYYAEYLTRLAAEANQIGAAGTWVYGEPHGKSIFEGAGLKRGSLADEDSQRIVGAIERATTLAPQADMVYPAGSANPKHYSFALRRLGKQFLHAKTYRVTDPARVNIKPPPGQKIQLDWWGTWITVHPSDAPPGQRPLTIEEWLAIDWDAVARRFPEITQGGVCIYAKWDEKQEVMQALGRAAAAR